MDRRHFLVALGALGITGGSRLPLHAQPASPIPQRRFIDAHCHFFNAKDLPIRGFIQQVVLDDYAQLKALPRERFLPMLDSVWKGLASVLIKTILNARAPDPREEMQCLSDRAACDDFAPFARSSRALTADAADQDRQARESRLLRFTLEDHYATAATVRTRAAREIADDADVDAFVGFVVNEMKQKGRIAPDASPERLRNDREARPRFLLDIADFLTGGDSMFSRYFRWADLLTSFRSQIISKYTSLYQTAQRRLVFAAPALVDYNYWLADQSPSDLRDQTKLMGLLSLAQTSPVHGFAPFDPARNLRREAGQPSSLAIVQEAVEQHGFIGVKLYSPMGFRPSGNAEERFYPPHVSLDDPAFGRKLDAELFDLYDWCAREEVPILAHTSDTQSANTDFSKRADPKFWLAVLEKHNDLRINLAHFGNFEQARTSNGFDLSLYAQTWEARIAGLIRDPRFKNVYADISYFSWILGEASTDAASVSQIKKLFAEFLKADPAAERLLFGTDWSMMARENKFELYLDNAESFFRDLGLDNQAIDNLFYRNAVRFFGLERGRKTYARLEAYYTRNGKPIPSFS